MPERSLSSICSVNHYKIWSEDLFAGTRNDSPVFSGRSRGHAISLAQPLTILDLKSNVLPNFFFFLNPFWSLHSISRYSTTLSLLTQHSKTTGSFDLFLERYFPLESFGKAWECPGVATPNLRGSAAAKAQYKPRECFQGEKGTGIAHAMVASVESLKTKTCRSGYRNLTTYFTAELRQI